MFNFVESISLILTGLKATIAQIAFKRRDRTEFLVFVHGRLGRTIQRCEQLYARWKNGTLPKPRAPEPGATGPAANRTPRLAKPQPFRLPRGRAWLLRELQHYEANGRASQFRHLLATSAELAEFLAAAPQAGRLLRPLCRMLGVAPPASARVMAPRAPATPEPVSRPPTAHPPPGPSRAELRQPSPTGATPPEFFSAA